MYAGRLLGRMIIATVASLSGAVALAGATPSYAADGGRLSARNLYGANLYVTHRNSGNITVLGIDQTGLPNPVLAPVATGAEPRGIVFTPDGTSAYVVNSAANTVSAYTRGEDGALRP